MKKLLFFACVFFSFLPLCVTALPPELNEKGIQKADTSYKAEADKFVYAEIVHQTNYGLVTQWVSGNTVSEDMRRRVAATKIRTEALDILGNAGWELISSSSRNFDNGFEIFYYLKKKVE